MANAQSPFNGLNQECWNCTNVLAGDAADSVISTVQILSSESVIALDFISVLACIIGSVGNALVLLVVFNKEILRTIPDFFITSLAFSDFTVCALFFPMSIYHFHHPNVQEENLSFFLIKRFLGHAAMVASATNMFAVTIDRVIAIRMPFKYCSVMTKLIAFVVIAIVWLISIVVGALRTWEVISGYHIGFYSAILLFSTITMYVYIFIAAKRQENRIQDVTAQVSDGPAMEKKVAKTIFTVVGVYTLCWLPILLLPAIISPSTLAFKKSFPWTRTLLACNSAFNPYIYCVRSAKYRSAFAKILRIRTSVN